MDVGPGLRAEQDASRRRQAPAQLERRYRRYLKPHHPRLHSAIAPALPYLVSFISSFASGGDFKSSLYSTVAGANKYTSAAYQAYSFFGQMTEPSKTRGTAEGQEKTDTEKREARYMDIEDEEGIRYSYRKTPQAFDNGPSNTRIINEAINNSPALRDALSEVGTKVDLTINIDEVTPDPRPTTSLIRDKKGVVVGATITINPRAIPYIRFYDRAGGLHYLSLDRAFAHEVGHLLYTVRNGNTMRAFHRSNDFAVVFENVYALQRTRSWKGLIIREGHGGCIDDRCGK